MNNHLYIDGCLLGVGMGDRFSKEKGWDVSYVCKHALDCQA